LVGVLWDPRERGKGETEVGRMSEEKHLCSKLIFIYYNSSRFKEI
jgi:hypothetical protein